MSDVLFTYVCKQATAPLPLAHTVRDDDVVLHYITVYEVIHGGGEVPYLVTKTNVVKNNYLSISFQCVSYS